MHKWSEAITKDDNNRIEVEKARKLRLINNQNFIKEQMDANQIVGPHSASAKKRADELIIKKKY